MVNSYRTSTFLFFTIFLSSQVIQALLNNVACKKFESYEIGLDDEDCFVDLDSVSDPVGIAVRYGYKIEEHEIKTKDGYILIMFRIPNGPTNASRTASRPKQPVLLAHSAYSNAAEYFALKNNSLAFKLADAGFDVWLANWRGSKYSQNHELYTKNSENFWDYSIDELAKYDLPSFLHLIKLVNGHKQVFFVGSGISSTVLLAFSSSQPEFAKETIKYSILYQPLLSPHQLPLLLGRFFKFIKLEKIWENIQRERLATKLSVGESFQSNIEIVLDLIGAEAFFQAITNLYGGANELYAEQLPYFINHEFSSMSIKVFLHYLQIWKEFKHFDYGEIKNMIVYEKLTPPVYDVKKILHPVYVIYVADNFTNETNVKQFYKSLSADSRKPGCYKLSISRFNRLTFNYGNAGKTCFISLVVKTLSSVNDKGSKG